jgi:hypothetical protein
MVPTVPAWIAAIAAAVLAIGAIVAAIIARANTMAQARHLAAQHEIIAQLAEVLPLQARALKQSLAERRREQACQVYIELTRSAGSGRPESASRRTSQVPRAAPPRVAATVHNASRQPVYDIYVIWQLGTVRMGKPDRAARLMPGQQVCFERMPEPAEGGSAVEAGALAAFLTFRDAAGVRWTVREDGTLTDISPEAHETDEGQG